MAETKPKQTSLQDELAAADRRSKSGSTNSEWPQPILASISAVKSVISTSKPVTLKFRQRKIIISLLITCKPV